jgi:hypothetical protein
MSATSGSGAVAVGGGRAFRRRSAGLGCILDQAALQVADVGLGQVLVLAGDDPDAGPEVLRLVRLAPGQDRVALADVGAVAAGPLGSAMALATSLTPSLGPQRPGCRGSAAGLLRRGRGGRRGQPPPFPVYGSGAWTGRIDKRGGPRKGSPCSPRGLKLLFCKSLNPVNLLVNLRLQGSPEGPRFTLPRDIRVSTQTGTPVRPAARGNTLGADPTHMKGPVSNNCGAPGPPQSDRRPRRPSRQIGTAVPISWPRDAHPEGDRADPAAAEGVRPTARELTDTKAIRPAQLLASRRPEDRKSELWTSASVVQEHQPRGGEWGRTETGRLTTRPVKGVGEDLRLNSPPDRPSSSLRGWPPARPRLAGGPARGRRRLGSMVLPPG